MVWKGIIDGMLVGFSASVPLGPIGVLCIQRTLQRGRLSGFVSGLGAASSDIIYAIIAGFSLSFIVTFIEEQFVWIQVFGSIILILLGWHIFRSNPAKQLRKQRSGKSKNSYLQDYVSTFLLTFSNPLAIFLFIAFFCRIWCCYDKFRDIWSAGFNHGCISWGSCMVVFTDLCGRLF